MTEAWIRDVAGRYGLTVHKRITTGNATAHFATFELTGPMERVHCAWPVVAEQGRGSAFDYCRNSDIDGAVYIGLESVWCEVEVSASDR